MELKQALTELVGRSDDTSVRQLKARLWEDEQHCQLCRVQTQQLLIRLLDRCEGDDSRYALLLTKWIELKSDLPASAHAFHQEQLHRYQRKHRESKSKTLPMLMAPPSLTNKSGPGGGGGGGGGSNVTDSLFPNDL